MLKTKNVLYKIALIVALLLIVVSVFLSLRSMLNPLADAWMILGAVLAIIGLLFAAYYIFSGYSKNEAAYYKAFAFLFAAAQLVSAIGCGVGSGAAFPITVGALAVGFTLVLALGKDLGKSASIVFSVIIIACCAAGFVSIFFVVPVLPEGTEDFTQMVAFRESAQVVLSLLMFMMVYA